MQESEIVAENGETLYEFQQAIHDEIAKWAKRKSKLDSALWKKYAKRARDLRTDRDSGVIHMPDPGVIVTCNARKSVTWDQKMLATKRDNIIANGDDPKTYMNIKEEFTIPEAVWNNWGHDSWQQKAFLDARTVRVAESFLLRLNEERK
jgi:hypothetical protein